ncbi:MAG: sulfite exporter TauE/SafE family protein [Candidatus Margulisbacteria bacterium]|nr:sulfite exporter TauE/SafE family protein [Candidatus Margulisiibacteriota bacterium]
MEIATLFIIGLLAGGLSGFIGIGGATIMIPALLLIYKMTQHMAQGTSIVALLLPVGALAAVKYWQAGNVNLKFAALIAIGFLIGGYIGAVFAQPVPDIILKRIFAGYLIVIALQMLFFSK